MKLVILASILSAAAVFSCNKVVSNPASAIDVSLENRLNADPEVHTARQLRADYSRALVALQPEAFLDVLAKLEACRLHHATANLSELKKCLEGNPAQESYIRCVQLLRRFEKSMHAVERRYPELTARSTDEKGRMILLLEEGAAVPAAGSVQMGRTIIGATSNESGLAVKRD